MISRIIKLPVRVISLSLQCQLINPLIILDITKTSCNNNIKQLFVEGEVNIICRIILETKLRGLFDNIH